MKMPALLFVNFFCMSMLTFLDLGSGVAAPKYNGGGGGGDRRDVLPPLVPPKFVDDDDDYEERRRDASPATSHLFHLGSSSSSSHWDPILKGDSVALSPVEEAAIYRQALINAIHSRREMMERNARSMGMLRMGRSASAADGGTRRSMTMLRMGRAFDEDDEEEDAEMKRSMGMLRMGRGSAAGGDDFRRSMSMLRMGRGISGNEDEDAEMKRSMGMLRMGRAAAAAGKSVDRGALNMLRMGKRDEVEEEEEVKADKA